jgi:hypothetical protein
MLSCFRRSLLVLSRNRVLVHLLQQMQLLQLQCLYPLLRLQGLLARNVCGEAWRQRFAAGHDEVHVMLFQPSLVHVGLDIARAR